MASASVTRAARSMLPGPSRALRNVPDACPEACALANSSVSMRTSTTPSRRFHVALPSSRSKAIGARNTRGRSSDAAREASRSVPPASENSALPVKPLPPGSTPMAARPRSAKSTRPANAIGASRGPSQRRRPRESTPRGA